MRLALEAAGARDLWDEDDDTAHLNGTARMGFDRETSVVDADCRSWDVPNLWICDGSVFPTVGGDLHVPWCPLGDEVFFTTKNTKGHESLQAGAYSPGG